MIPRIVLALSLLLGSQLAMAQQAKYLEGIHYFNITQLPAETGSDVVEVTEIFSYECSHCNTFEPYIQSWNKQQTEIVKLNRIPVVFGRKAWEIMARGYIVAEMMGIADDSHVAMMDARWKQGKKFHSAEQLADFYSAFGVKKSAFLAHFDSFAADSQLRKSQRDVQLFGISGTPSLVVNRKYRIVSSKDVRDFNAMLSVVDYLVALETAAP